ncbi:MAG: hypothetical protein AAF206_08815 [Bacteroidota bacterium]
MIKYVAARLLCAFCLVCLLTACNSDGCKDVNCGLQGTCVDGDCECQAGFEIDEFGGCGQRTAEKLAGNYRVTSSTGQTPGCNTGEYTLIVQASPTRQDGLLILNLGQYVCSNNGDMIVSATVKGPDRFDFDVDIRACNQYTMIGSGTWNEADSSITLNYRAEYTLQGSQVVDECAATLQR